MLALAHDAALAAPKPHAPAALAGHASATTSRPIINLGLPKSGSSSVADFFECGGLQTSHWSCGDDLCGACAKRNVAAGRPILASCGDYDVWAQIDVTGGTRSGVQRYSDQDLCFLPQVTHLRELHEQFPNALFVLPTRPIEHWLASVNTWGDMYDRLFECSLPGLNRQGKSREEQDHLLAQFYYNHTIAVREFMAMRPRQMLLEFAIEEDADLVGPHLESVTGFPASCWGKANCKASCGELEEMLEIKETQRAMAQEIAEALGPRD